MTANDNYLLNLEHTRAKLRELIELYNAGQIEPFIAEHSDGVIFATPDSCGTLVYGAGKLQLTERVKWYQDHRGRFTLLDVFPVGNSVSLLMEDEAGHRSEFCLEMSDRGLVKSIYAFHVRRTELVRPKPAHLR